MFGKLFLRLFGSGRLPAEGASLIAGDPTALVAESLVGSVTVVNFRAPGRYSSWRRQWFLGSLAVTKDRLVAYRYCKRLVNVPWDDPRVQQIKFSVPKPGCLLLAYDASLFQPTWSGIIELRFTTADADRVLRAIEAGLRRPGRT